MMAILRLLKHLVHAALIRPLVRILLCPGVRQLERLPLTGPAVIVANHNSHLDTLLLMSLFPLPLIDRVRPVAARDYFLRNPFLAFCVLTLFGVVPINRRPTRRTGRGCLHECSQALDARDILIVFPEGTRGEPGRLGPFKTGIAHLGRRYPRVPFIPVYLDGVGRALPKGRIVPVPGACTVGVGASSRWCGNRKQFMHSLRCEMEALAGAANVAGSETARGACPT